MKKLILLLNLLAAGAVGFGQSRIIIDEYLVQRREHNDISYQWTINGVTFTLDAAEVTVYPHREGLDTIFFQETVNRRTFGTHSGGQSAWHELSINNVNN